MSGEFDLRLKFGDIEMMYDIMQYGVTRMVFGGEKNSREAVARFEALFEQIRAMSPLPEEGRSRGGSSFFDAFRAAETCDSFEVVVEKTARPLDQAVISVLVDENGATSRFDLTHWLKLPSDADGRKDPRQIEDVFAEYAERLADMLVETSPVHAVRFVKYSAPILVHVDDWTWGDELKGTLQKACEETFGLDAEYREHRWTKRSDGHPDYVGVDVVFAAPAGFDAEMQDLARERTEEILKQAGVPVR